MNFPSSAMPFFSSSPWTVILFGTALGAWAESPCVAKSSVERTMKAERESFM
ncbi:MAG: hypothetical protein ACE5F1_04715 [Planctomycetota bacterium]